jgi:hypothetical protein
MKVSDLSKVIEETISKEIKSIILNEKEGGKTAYCIKCEGEYVEVCQTKEEADQKCEEYNKNNPNKEYVVEVETYESEEELIDKLDELGENLDSENMEENQSMDEKLHGGQHKLDVDGDGNIESSDLAALRKGEKPEDTNESQIEENIDDIQCETCGKEICECGDAMEEEISEETCEKCGKELCECGELNESKKERRVLRLTESQLIDMISKIVNESVPGLTAVEDAHKESEKETKEHMANVDKKIKDALSIDGNDNPDFPKQVGKEVEGSEDPTVNNTEEQDEEMTMDRGEHMLDLDYDHEPSEGFKDRVKKALEGDSTMGNADGGNTIPTKTGENLAKAAEKRKEMKEKAPMYVKDVQPVKVVKESKEEKNVLLEEEIKKMMKLSSYNEKTQ